MAANDPSAVYQTQVGFAPSVDPYAMQLLGAAQSRTLGQTNPDGSTTGGTPFQSYGQWAQSQGLSGDQIAQFTDMQKNAFDAAQNLGQNQYSQNAAAGTQNLLQNSWTNPGTAQQFMSPYEQNVIQLQQNDAARQAGIQNTYNDAQATGAGAFGGSRQAIMDAESQRNLGVQQANIEASGLQNAYTQGQNQFNAQQQQGLAGLNQLGSMGQNLYGQTMGNINLQDQLGTQQQQQGQNMINANINDYTSAKNYPYQQMGFMSDIIRGLPTNNLSQTVYQAPPSALGTVAGLGALGTGLLGSSGTTPGKARGGVLKSRAYKRGGLATLLAHSIG